MEESVGFLKKELHLRDVDVSAYSPLVLAYIGDAAYELVIRTKVVNEGNRQVNKLHKESAGLVKASAQTAMINTIMDDLTEEELAVFKRGRNAKSASTAKNATIREYRTATGFEALMGYLYLTEQYDRMITLISRGLYGSGLLEETIE